MNAINPINPINQKNQITGFFCAIRLHTFRTFFLNQTGVAGKNYRLLSIRQY